MSEIFKTLTFSTHPVQSMQSIEERNEITALNIVVGIIQSDSNSIIKEYIKH